MMNDEALRNECKAIKAFKGISYKKQAELLGIHYNSFGNWLRGTYDFSDSRKRDLERLTERLKGA